MAKTTNLNLELTTDNTTIFEDWRIALNGDGVGTELSPFSNMQLIDNFAGAIYGTSGAVTLLVANWVVDTYTLTVADLGANDAIFFTPTTATDKSNIESASFFISASGTTVTITAVTPPIVDIGLDYFISRGKA